MTKLHHVSIAVQEFDPMIKLFVEKGGKVNHKGYAEKYDCYCVFIEFENIMIELIKARTKDNKIQKFVDKRGNCLHHIAFEGKGKFKGSIPSMIVDFEMKQNILLEEISFDG